MKGAPGQRGSAPAHHQRLRAVAGYLVAVVALVWVFHDVELEPMLRGMRHLGWAWVWLAVVVDLLSYMTQGLRWKCLLAPVGRVRWFDATVAIYAGLFASEVLPLRAGELVRAFVVSRRLNTGVAAVVPSIMVERLFDGMWLALGIGVAAMLVPLPRDLLWAGDVLGVLMVLATALLAYAIVRVPDEGEAGADKVPVGRLERFRRHFRDIGRRHETYVAFGLSLVLLTGQVLAFWLMMMAYGLHVRVWVGAVVLLIVHLGTAIPNAPANIGTYQFFCVVGLMLFGVDKTRATGFSVVVFVVLTVPLWVLGSLALGRSGATLASVRTVVNAERSVGE